MYRRGHNGPDSKSGIRQRIVGSNPTASAKIIGYLLVAFCFARWVRTVRRLRQPRGSPLGVSVVSHRFRQKVSDFTTCFLFNKSLWCIRPIKSDAQLLKKGLAKLVKRPSGFFDN